MSITIPPQLVDINLEPNKTKVLLKNEVELIKLIDGILNDYYKNEDFHCSALKEALEEVEFFEDLEVVEEFSEEHKTKKPRLENKECKKISEKKISQDFVEKNTNWELKIIHEDVDNNFNSSLQTIVENENCQSDMHSVALSLCSQINKDNSVLATNDEVLELNAKLNEKTFQSVISTNSKNSVTRLVERNDLQSHPAEKKVLPEWPIRNSEAVANQDPIEIDTLSEISLNNSELPKVVEESTKSLKELAAEIESDAEKWSSEILKAMENEDCKKFSPSLEEEAANFDLSMQSISSQMGKKEMKAFTKFARIMRPKSK